MKTVAVVGATGLVGEKLVALIADLPNIRIRCFGKNSVGTRLQIGRRTAVVESRDKLVSACPDYAVFVANEEISAQYIPRLVGRGVVCIDNSSFFRLRRNVPLVVPCINGCEVRGCKLIANPNCSTVQVATALAPLRVLRPTKLTAVTYQSASGAGRDALDDLTEGRTYGRLKSFRHPICDNLLPMIGNLRPDGYTTEERKLVDESRKILHLPRLKVNAFCVRVPVTECHGVFVNVAFAQKFDLDEVRSLLRQAPNVLLMDDAQCGLYPMPLTLKNTKYVGVGRVTKDITANAINFFCVADNLMRGAAYNAYEILLEKLKESQKCL